VEEVQVLTMLQLGYLVAQAEEELLMQVVMPLVQVLLDKVIMEALVELLKVVEEGEVLVQWEQLVVIHPQVKVEAEAQLLQILSQVPLLFMQAEVVGVLMEDHQPFQLAAQVLLQFLEVMEAQSVPPLQQPLV
jgi:hypothetical protein